MEKTVVFVRELVRDYSAVKKLILACA